MKAWTMSLLLLVVSVTHWSGHSTEGKVDLLIPDELARCMSQVGAEADDIEFIYVNPFYLRGDFDGDGRGDYVAQVESGNPKSEPCLECTGVLFCFGSSEVEVLGTKRDPLPASVDPMYFLSSHWEIPSTADPEVKSLGADGEVVEMRWEDARGKLYLENNRFIWKFEWTMPGLGEDLKMGLREGE